MHTTVDFLDQAKERLQISSDYALAKELGITRASVSRLRNQKDYFGDETAMKVAELLEVDPAIVVSAAHAERAKKPEERAVWRSIYERLSKGLAVVLVGAGLAGAGAPGTSHAAASDAPKSLYIMSNLRRRLIPAFA